MTQTAIDPPQNRHRWRLWLVLAMILLIGLLGLGLTRDPGNVPSALVGQPMPRFALPLLEGAGTLDSAEAAGRPLILNFWASWCPTCRQEHPVLLAMGLRARMTGEFGIAGINSRDTIPHAMQFLEREGRFPYASAYDPRGRTGIDFGVYGMPETFFIDASGVVRARHPGPLTPTVLARYLPLIGVTP